MSVTRWYFGLDAETIRQGHHPDFFRGQQTAFSVHASMEAAEARSGGTATAGRVEDCHYDVVARVVAVAGDSWVLDCGLLVHAEGHEPVLEVAVGQWMAGRARLEVSPAADAEAGFSLDDGVRLTRTWYVERVHHRVDVDEALIDPRLAALEPVDAGWEELAFTESWHDDGGAAYYLLECVLAENQDP